MSNKNYYIEINHQQLKWFFTSSNKVFAYFTNQQIHPFAKSWLRMNQG